MNLKQLFGALFFVFLLFPLATFAQDSAGVSIEPATVDHAADPGQVINARISVKNLSSVEQTYYMISRNIVGVREGSVPIYADQNQEETGFELSSWIELPSEPYTLAPGEETTVPVVVRVPSNASPGDHFAGVFASVQPPKLRETGAGVGYDVASIFTIKISGTRVVNAQIREFSTEDIIHGSTNVDFNVRIQNTGTDIVHPFGPLEVFNMFGRRVHVTTFNDTSAGVFPGTVRDFVLNWSDENPGFGRYQANIALTYEAIGGSRTINATTPFWILPMNIIGPAAIVLIVLLLISYVFVKLYIRRAVQQVSGGSQRRLVRTRGRSKQVSALMLVSIVLLTVTAVFLILLLILFA